MAKLIVISWRDVPAQVVVKRGRETGKVQLSHRFQEAVDRAAMRAGKASSGDYLADWKRSDPKDCGDDIQAEANAEAARIEALYSDEDLLVSFAPMGWMSIWNLPPSLLPMKPAFLTLMETLDVFSTPLVCAPRSRHGDFLQRF